MRRDWFGSVPEPPTGVFTGPGVADAPQDGCVFPPRLAVRGGWPGARFGGSPVPLSALLELTATDPAGVDDIGGGQVAGCAGGIAGAGGH